MNLKPTSVLLLFFLFLLSCEKWDLEQQEFLQVELTSVDSLSIDSVRISGRITDLAVGPVKEHGFLWTTESALPFIYFNEGQRELDIKAKEGDPSFSAILKLEPNTRYIFRAYATVDREKYIYSESREYHTGNAQAFTLAIDYQRGFSLQASGRLSGTEKGFVAVKHGFCWSTIHPQPTLGDHFVNLGERRNDEIFTGTIDIDSLQNNNLHYIRAYAVLSLNLKLDTIFGPVLPFDGDLNFWSRKADFQGEPRTFAVGFSIGQKGYIGTGREASWKKDFWEYDPLTDTWTQRADFGGGPRAFAVGFSIGQKGYIGIGGEALGANKKDFWEYDPLTDTWAQRADFGGGLRSYAVGFSIGQKGYIGTGLDGGGQVRKDFWEYDPLTDTWTRRADFGGESRYSAVGFSIGQKGYIGTGRGTSSTSRKKDFSEYNPLAGSWVRKADFAGGERDVAAGFSIGQKGYIGTGLDESNRQKDFWEYDPQADTWVQQTNFAGPSRYRAVGFSIGQKGYIGTGTGGTFGRTDFWEYDP